MAKMLIDMSGRKGLSQKHYGDSDNASTFPQRRYLVNEGEMASGTFNPFFRDGYLSPAVNTLHTLTADQTISAVPAITQYDQIYDDFYFGERGRQIFKGDGLTDTSLVRVKNLSSGSTLNDIEIYQVNGIRKLFYVYTSQGTQTLSGTFSTTTGYRSMVYTINPSGSTTPGLHSTTRTTAASGTTLTGSFTVPTLSNAALIVYTFNYSLNNTTGVTFNGDAMTSFDTTSGTSGGQAMSARLWYLANPDVATGDIVATWAGSENNIGFQAFLFTDVSQATPATSVGGGNGNTTSFSSSPGSSSTKQVMLSLVAESATVTVTAGQSLYNATNTLPGQDVTLMRDSNSSTLNMGIASLPFAVEDDTWLTATVSGAFTNQTNSDYNFLRTADNGFAYLFSGNTIHRVDGTTLGGTNGTVTPNVIVFPPFFTITDAVDYRGNIYAVIHQTPITVANTTQVNKTTPAGVYIWDRQTTQVKMSDYIPVEGVRVIRKIYVAPKGQVRLITVSSDGITEIRQFNGSTFEVIKDAGIGAAPQYPDGLITAGQKTLWVASDASLYCHAPTRPGEPEILARVARITEPTATTAGTANAIVPGGLIYGWDTDTGTSGYRNDRQGITIGYSLSGQNIKRIFPFDMDSVSGQSQLAHQGDIYTGLKPLPTLSTVQVINVFMAAGTTTGTTTAATLKIYFNGSSTAWASKTVTRDDVARGYKNIKVGKPYVNSVQIEVEYPTGTAMSDAYDFHPFYAEVIYEPTSALSAA